MENTIIKLKDNEYTLTQEAYLSGTPEDPYYTALSLAKNGQVYQVIWDIYPEHFDCDDASNACDWNNPREMVPVGLIIDCDC